MQKNGSSFVTAAVYHRIGPAGHQPQAIWRRLGGRRASLLSSILARTLTCAGRRRVRRIRRWVSSRRLTRPGAGRPQVVPYQGFGSGAWNGDRVRGGRPEWCGRAGSKRGCGPSRFGKYTRRIKAHILYNHLATSDLGEEYLGALIDHETLASIIDHKNYNPRTIRAITDTLNTEAVSVAGYPDFCISSLDPQTTFGKSRSKISQTNAGTF
ncbi:hypothetical protein IVB27_30910 [Bradyrhizobium sp. 197]|uniref:hypothetical protein n=1 Tax=Bradyrhizobium sp. 197 TaxID=2782663 RepID=UPI001FF7FC12|nr:hypothetical protein [Bradyrhizobium sp. 197]MCK1479033.1 hypothetical protein [Bradyrhizobium sp. 197]